MQGHTLNWCQKQLKSLNEEFITDPKMIKHLDISNNNIYTGRSLDRFNNLITLIMDSNHVQNLYEFPILPQLEHLSLINNQINDLEELIKQCRDKFPKLNNLNLMKNPICPSFFMQQQEYHEYRMRILQSMKHLKILDGFPVTDKDFQPFISDEVEEVVPNIGSVKEKIITKKEFIDGDKVNGIIEQNQKYAKIQSTKNVLKTTSQGNKYIKNDKL